MQITKDYSVNFTARNLTVQQADNIARKVNKCFHHISPTLVEDWHVVNKDKRKMRGFIKRLDDSVEEMRDYKEQLFNDAESAVERMLAFMTPVKKYKFANCGDCAQIAAIVAKVNGIRNAHLAEVYTKRGKDLDHMVVYVDDEKPYIIDAWLGIADYVPNMMQKYKSEYRKHFDLPPIRDGIKFIKTEDDCFSDAINEDLSRRQKNKLLKFYPEILIRKY